jgi:hypothetical protein
MQDAKSKEWHWLFIVRTRTMEGTKGSRKAQCSDPWSS